MKLRRFFLHAFINLEYKILLPVVSRLPACLAFKLFKLRGLFQYVLDFEWKTVALNRHFMRAQTQDAFCSFVANREEKRIRQLVRNRFVHESWDEYLNCLFSRPKIKQILASVEIESLDELKAAKESSGIVFVSIHYDAFCMGLTALGYNGFNMHVVNTEGIENEDIPVGVREYYQLKYSSMERLMNGRMPYVERSKAPFYEALKNHECVGLMGDIPGNKSTLNINFLGKSLRLPLGAWKFAKESNAKLSAFVCIRERDHQYRLYTLPPYYPNDNPLESMSPVYEFLEQWIKRHPDRWTSSYLLQGYSSPIE